MLAFGIGRVILIEFDEYIVLEVSLDNSFVIHIQANGPIHLS